MEKYSEPIFERKVCLIIEREQLKREVEISREKYERREKLGLFRNGLIRGFIVGAVMGMIVLIILLINTK